MDREISIRIGGDRGQGVESIGAALARALARSGLHPFAMQDYRSRARGGRNLCEIRAATRPVHAQSDPPHLIPALTPETLRIHLPHLARARVFCIERIDPQRR